MEQETQGRSRWSWGRMAAVASVPVLLVVAAAAAPDGFALKEERSRGRFVLPATPVMFKFILAGLGILALLVALWSIVQAARSIRGRRHATWSDRTRQLFVFVVGVGLVFALVSLVRHIDSSERTAAPPGAAPSPAPADFASHSRSLGLVLTLLAGALLVGGALALLRLVRPDRLARAEDRAARTLAEEIRAGIEDLRSIADPRTAVIACYARMVRALAASGLRPSRSDTPLELLRRVLLDQRVAERSVRRLTELFEMAKFSQHPVDEDMRAAALDALEDVRSQLWASERTTGLVLAGTG